MTEIVSATLPVAASPVRASQEEEFLALLCADEQLVRAEFDAIIAAGWPAPPPGPGSRMPARGGPPARPRRRFPDRSRQCRVRHPGAGGWRRQRSPPAAT
jgi:hypothetical protein